jgi:alkyl hydroperoxide reductase subunit D
MDHVEKLRALLPEAAKDIKVNLGNVLVPGTLNEAQVWGTALACAFAARNPTLLAGLLAQARASNVEDGVVEDAKAAAILMGMNNVFYRFRHIVGKEEYPQKPARLRMQRLAQVTSNRADFELFCLAVSAINNCETCVQSHEAAVIERGLTPDHVHDAIRIAAVVNATAVALETSLEAP